MVAIALVLRIAGADERGIVRVALIAGSAPTVHKFLAHIVFRRNAVENILIEREFTDLVAECIVEAGGQRELFVAHGGVERSAEVGFAASATCHEELHDAVERFALEQMLAILVVIEERQSVGRIEAEEAIAVEGANALSVDHRRTVEIVV